MAPGDLDVRVVDVETTGLDDPRVVEIAIADVELAGGKRKPLWLAGSGG